MRAAIAIGAVVMGLSGEVAARPRNAPAPLDEDVALGLSVAGTTVAWTVLIGGAASNGNEVAIVTVVGIGLVGTLFAPSAGHWYAGKVMTQGLGMRLVGLGTTLAGAATLFATCPLVGESPCNETYAGAAAVLLLTGATIYIGGTIDDLNTVTRRVRQHNQRLEKLAIVPTLQRGGAGLAIGGTF
ncbi:MAG: hypothetical protein ACTHU0_07500 [Kofleriaceae bacterium]